MPPEREGLLAQIATGVVDDAVPLTTLLRMCVVLGGEAGSQEMREWAKQELRGYVRPESLPEYRRVFAPLMMRLTNNVGYNPISQELQTEMLPEQIRDLVDWNEVPLASGVGELEAMADNGRTVHHLGPNWAGPVAAKLNEWNTAPQTRVSQLYWEVQNASVRGVIARIRDTLAELVAELITVTPQDQPVPDKEAMDHAVTLVVNGDPTITVTSQNATSGGANITMDTSPAGSVTVAGTDGTAIGSQTVHGDDNTMIGRDNTAENESIQEGWWTRWHTWVVGIATIVAAAVGVFAWIGWNPW